MSHSDGHNLAYVVVSVDTESDQYLGDDSVRPGGKDLAGWRGLEIGKGYFVEEIARVADKLGRPIPITWFVRSDGQVASVHGDSMFLFKQFERWWADRLGRGDELQWHAHLYRLDSGEWVQEEESERLEDQLRSSLASMNSGGYSPTVIRIGEAYSSNNLMHILAALGIKADSSALPGRKRIDGEKRIDWTSTTCAPYHPSALDYRIAGPDSLGIWELPLSTVRTKVEYDKESLLRYVNLSFNPPAYVDDFGEYFQRCKILISITHPFEIVPLFNRSPGGRNHPLISFSRDSVSANLMKIAKQAEERGFTIKFIRMEELIDLLEEGVLE
jgi:hypothetical protein